MKIFAALAALSSVSAKEVCEYYFGGDVETKLTTVVDVDVYGPNGDQVRPAMSALRTIAPEVEIKQM